MNTKSKNASVKEIAVDYNNRLWNDKNVDIIDQLVDPNVIIHSAIGDFQGSAAMKNVAKTWLTAFPDMKTELNIVISENDIVSIQWKVKATHKGEFKGKAPNGKPVTYSGVTVYRIKDHKIVEYWAYIDMQQLLSQMN